MDKEISKYIEKQKSPQKEMLEKLRKIILKTLPNCKEEMRWGVPVFAGGKIYIVGLRDSVNIGFAVTGLSKEDSKYFKGSGKLMRHIKISSPKEIDQKHLAKIIKFVNRKAVCKPC